MSERTERDGSVPDYYEILQISPNAGVEIIEAAYRRLALWYQSDRVGGHSGGADAARRMDLLNEAYAVLRDPLRRAQYDLERMSRAEALPGAGRSVAPSDRPRLVVRTNRITLRAIPEEPIVGGGFAIENGGGGALQGAVTAEPSWLDVTPDRFIGSPVSVLMRADTRELSPGRWHLALIRIRTNGGEAHVTVAVQAPRRFAPASSRWPSRRARWQEGRPWRGVPWAEKRILRGGLRAGGQIIGLFLFAAAMLTLETTLGNGVGFGILIGVALFGILLGLRYTSHGRRVVKAGRRGIRAARDAATRTCRRIVRKG